MPVTPPEPLIVATDVLSLAHDIPPVVASDRKVTLPTHALVVPAIGNGAVLTVML
jgi:hypothetical protein